MFEAVLAGATDPEIEGVEVVRRPALTVSPVDMLEADGYLLGTPANLGYISGALKHAFDCAYYQLLDTTRGRPFGVYLHGNEGTEGAERGLAAITTGLGWVQVAETVVAMGKPSKADVEACWNLGATVAARGSEWSRRRHLHIKANRLRRRVGVPAGGCRRVPVHSVRPEPSRSTGCRLLPERADGDLPRRPG